MQWNVQAKNMSGFDTQVLDILTKSLKEEPIKNIRNWLQVLNDLKNQATICIPYDAINRGGCLTNDEMKAYKLICYQNITNNTLIMSEQRHMLELFEMNNIPVVLLKGSAVAMYYPQPRFRILGDIDIIVKPEDYAKAYQLLGENYQCTQTQYENPRHSGFIGKSGVLIELHRYFSFGRKVEKKQLLDQIIYEGIDRREWHKIGEYNFPCLPSIENGLVILSHICQHIQANGIGYRQLIDFREFVVAEREQINTFLAVAEKVGLAKLAEVLIAIYNKYMGTDINISMEKVDDVAVDALLQMCMHAGNFGGKETMDVGKRSAIVLKRFKHPVATLVLFQRFGRTHWKATDKYVFLRPFAWIYQIGYYFKQVKINGGLSVIVEGKQQLEDKKSMLKRLHLWNEGNRF